MRVRGDILVTVVIVLLGTLGVLLQLGDPFGWYEEEPIRKLDMGEVLEVDFTLSDVSNIPLQQNLMSWYGKKATVLYTWSVPCPCVDLVDKRLKPLYEKMGPEQGVSWIAIAGDPTDGRANIRLKMQKIKAFYRLLVDPDQLVIRRLGLFHAAMIAVLDGEGRIVYRGAIDADYDEGKAEFLEEALTAVVEGRPVPVPERAWTYGCEFAVPESCIEYQREGLPTTDEGLGTAKQP